MIGKIRFFLKQYSAVIMPIVYLIVAVTVLLVIFLNHNMKDAHSRAQEEIVADALILERSVDLKLSHDKAVLALLQGSLSETGGVSDDSVPAILNNAVQNSAGYEAMVTDREGNAAAAAAGSMSIAGLTWFEKVSELPVGEIQIFHLSDDEISGTDAVVCAGGIAFNDGSEGVCLYFDGTWLEALSKTGKGKSLMTIVDQSGRIIMRSGISDYFVRGEDYWKLLGDNVASTAKYHIIQKDNYAVYNATSNYTVVEIPMQGVAWAACVSVSGSYINSLAGTFFNATKNLVIMLAVAVFIFFALIIILNLVSKAKRIKESQALGAKADHDQLTGLRNKAATERDIKDFMRTNPTSQSVLFILDIDDFKSVNDTMGHSFGDDVLHEFGFSLGAMFRASDVAGRIGGDEFMVLVKNLPNEDLIEKESKKIRDFIKSFRAGEGVKREVTASAGAAVFPTDGADFETLYKAADKALYESKRGGKRQLSFFRK